MKQNYISIVTITMILGLLLGPGVVHSKNASKLVDPTRPDYIKLKSATKANASKSKKRNRKTSIHKLKLQQTIISQFKKVAVINGKRLTIGKSIRGAKLIGINENNVVMRYKNRIHTLHLTFSSDIKEVER